MALVVLDVILHGHLADTLHMLMLLCSGWFLLNYGLLTFFLV